MKYLVFLYSLKLIENDLSFQSFSPVHFKRRFSRYKKEKVYIRNIADVHKME